MEYPKIETLYNRDTQTFKVIPGELRLPEFALVTEWLVTEKIDGTNIRILLDSDGTVQFRGKTDAAQIPPFLLDRLAEIFPAERVAAAFDPETYAVLFGEGYGAKIQKGGGNYCEGQSFRLFDVAVMGEDRVWWLNWADVEDVARKLGIHTVPVIARGISLETAVWRLRYGLESLVARDERGALHPAEGIVARTEPLLFTRRGDRLMWKLKTKDF